MTLTDHYDAQARETELAAAWEREGVYRFQPAAGAPVYAIDTPPPSVSGHLHLGHVYSYAHADFFARYRRMRGDAVFYPMGFDDNGLPTERLVERERGVRAADIGRQAFIRECLAVSEAAERQYEALWRRLGLSIDWRYTYRTIDDESRRVAQWGFLDLLRQDLAYRQQAPTIWCPECGTAISQAEVNEEGRRTDFYTLAFDLADGGALPIATTRPELLPACVAVFVNPDDARYNRLIGRDVVTPLFGRRVPILADPAANPAKGTGAVMCCTFGDTTDVAWWRAHDLPLIEVIGRDGRLSAAAGPYAGLSIAAARRRIVADIAARAGLLDAQPLEQTVRVHERCDTAVETIISRQWFVRVLDQRARFLDAGDRIAWHPEHMGTRYRQWVENLNWDWCISRQRTFGVPFPLWYCAACGEAMTPDLSELPIDPSEDQPARPCTCGGTAFVPETDVMDTWATSSLSPQIVGRFLADPALFQQVFPMTLRPQAHEIIRTWAFYTIVRSLYHTGQLPWQDVAISGWGLAADGEEKLSKSRAGKKVTGPEEMLARHSADAVRYWAAGSGLGKDAVINEKRIQAGAKWVTKLWHVARFSERFLSDYACPPRPPADLTTADRWLLARLNQLIAATTASFDGYDYATARSEIEEFFWRDLADNYLEMAKKRLYDGGPGHEAARYTLYVTLDALLKLLAPLLPYVTDAIYRALFAGSSGPATIHHAQWPRADERLDDRAALDAGVALLDIATTARRFKSERNLSPGAAAAELQLSVADEELRAALEAAELDLLSITRARAITFDQAGNGTDWLAAGAVAIRLIL